jgi:hypothetical protein
MPISTNEINTSAKVNPVTPGTERFPLVAPSVAAEENPRGFASPTNRHNFLARMQMNSHGQLSSICATILGNALGVTSWNWTFCLAPCPN